MDAMSQGTDGSDMSAGEAQARLRALSLIRAGRLFDLSSGWWRGMPNHDSHPRFDIHTYRTPRGQRLENDVPIFAEGNDVNYRPILEVITGSVHTGTHIDALCHATEGPNDEWHGGVPAAESLGDFGALRDDASQLPPIIRRGVLADVPRALGLDTLPAHYAIGADLLRSCLESQGTELHAGDVLLVRTGLMKYWPDPVAMEQAEDAGLNLEAADYLSDLGLFAVGADTATTEVSPSGVGGVPQPVHLQLLVRSGVHLIEWIRLEELSAAEAFEFCFLALPLDIRGATGSMIRPVALN